MADSWRLPVRRAEASTLRGVHDALGAPWSKELAVERYNDKLFGGVGCVEYSAGGRFLAVSARSQALVLRLPFRSMTDTAAALGVSNCVWNEQLPRTCFTTRFRPDERLAIMTVDRRVIVRSTETAFERNFDGHTRDVRDAAFLTAQVLASVSDDATVRLWSLTQTNEIAVAAGAHTDYVRTMCVLSERVFATGSFDRSILLWDVRSDMKAPAMSFRAEHPVEKVVAHAGAPHALYAAAADVVMVLDIRRPTNASGGGSAGGSAAASRNASVVSSASFHTKTVASLAVHADAGTGAVTVVSGGLDKRIKVLRQMPDGSLLTVASRKAQSGVTALAVNPAGTQFAVGLQDGHASAFDIDTHVTTSRGEAGDDGAVHADRGAANASKQSVIKETAAAVRKERAIASWLRRIHALLSRYRYGLALKTALYSKFDDVIVSTLDELQRRCALHVAVSGHNDRTIVQLLRFATAKVCDPALAATCVAALDRVFEIYAPAAAESEYFHRELLRCHHVLEELSADVEHIRVSAAILELLVQ